MSSHRGLERLPAVTGYRLGLVCLLAGQAAWCWWLSARGWFYQDDLSALDEADGRRLGWRFLTMPVNDHLVPGYRLAFWLQSAVDPLNYQNTVVVRVLLQTVAVGLLYRLLVLLFGRRPGVLAVLALYAVNPLIVANLTWLTTAACLVPAEIAAILALDCHVRYAVTGRLRWAAGAGAALLAGMCFWEKTAIIGVVLPVLSLGYLSSGPIRGRLAEQVRHWRGWLLTAVPPLLFVGYFFGRHYGGSARGIGAGDLLEVNRTAWLRLVAPALFGGPWSWFDAGNAYVSWSSPSTTAVVISQFGFLLLVVLGWRRTGARSLVGWSIPALSVVLGTTLVSIGRFFAFGDLVAVTMRYSYDFALVLALGAALALLPTTPAAIANRALGGHPVETGPGNPAPAETAPGPAGADRGRSASGRYRLALAAAACLALLVSSAVSTLRFEHRWLQNPTKPYLDRLAANLAAAGPAVNLYDTPVSTRVVPYFFGPTMHLSRLLSWTDARVRFDQTDSAPLLVDLEGNLQAANLLPAAYGVLPPGQTCEVLAHGVGTWRVPLTKRLPYGEGFLRLEYFQQRASTMTVQVEDASGRLMNPTTGSRVSFPVTLGAQLLRLPPSEAVAVVFRSESAAMNICIGAIVIGAPFAPAR
ncbi:MAG: hypothetical protein QOE23_705 [Pseudonocardiales bacterium]|nr:hypothetical protein [Pseudonocardiales bacterium]